MTFETALRARIRAGLPAEAGASVEWGKRPQGRFPAIVLTLVTLPLGRHMGGFNGARAARVQIDVMTLDKPMVTALREIVVQIVAVAATVGGVRFGAVQGVGIASLDEDTDTGPVFRDMIEATFWHSLEN